MIYYDIVEVFLDENGGIKEKVVGSKGYESEAQKLMQVAKKLNPNKEYYVREDDSLDW